MTSPLVIVPLYQIKLVNRNDANTDVVARIRVSRQHGMQHHGAERPLQHFYRNEIVCNGQIF
jgi:hypothetical protein